MPVSIVVIVAIAIIVLTVVMYFFIFHSGEAMSESQAQKIYYSKCEIIKQNGCNVFEAEKDKEFLTACKVLFSKYDAALSGLSTSTLAFSCLKISHLGNSCCEPVDPECYWRSSRSEGLFGIGADKIDIQNSCNDMKAICPNTITTVCV